MRPVPYRVSPVCVGNICRSPMAAAAGRHGAAMSDAGALAYALENLREILGTDGPK
jgi:hypothetical protein